jgi:hypothetical protein
MSNALDGLRQFASDTVTISVVEAERCEAIAARNFSSAVLVNTMREQRAAAPPHVRCSACLQRLDEVAAYLHVWMEPVREKEFHFVCTGCGHADEVVQAVRDRLTLALCADAGIRQDDP